MVTETPQVAFDKIVIDTIGPLPRPANGNTYTIDMAKGAKTVTKKKKHND